MTEVTEAEKKDVVPSQYRDKYKETGGTCGDFIAINLQKISKDGVEGLNTVKADNGIEAERWAGFNPGMQRMNLANVLRGSYLKGETIVILGKHYNAVDQVEADFNGTVAEDDNTLLRVASFLELQANPRTVSALRGLFFPKPKGPSAEDRAKAKAEKDEAAAKLKAEKAEAAAKAKAEKAEAKAEEKAKAKLARDEAKAERDRVKAEEKAKKAEEAAKAKAAAAAAKAEQAAKSAE